MASTRAIIFRGKVGHLVYYEYRGKANVRSAPVQVRQTHATKDSAKRFGLAVSMSAVIRAALGSVLPGDTDRQRMYLLNKKLYQWLDGSLERQPGGDPALSVIKGFELNPAKQLPAAASPSDESRLAGSGAGFIDAPRLCSVK